ncbi:hypothetical protein [Providencia stuartii]|uniref:hypothetical protein n=1 Tax=Providencia stuartii TaxID=588 RepID=UPI00112470DB
MTKKPIKAHCKRKNCHEPVYDNVDARHHYLCEQHYDTKMRNINRRYDKGKQQCERQGCKRYIKKTQNKRFCSNACRHRASRVVDNSLMTKTIRHSYWRNIERFIQLNPKQMGSIDSLTDIAEMIKLYTLKAKYQKSYVAYDESEDEIVKLLPFLSLDLCHLYPNSLGGKNTGLNTLIAPTKINRKRRHKLPASCPYPILMGQQSENECIPMTGSLYQYLNDYCSDEEILALFQEIGKLKEYYFYRPKEVNFELALESLLLSQLLCDECRRLGLKQISIKFNALKKLFLLDGYFCEIIAICLFYALLSGDEDKLIESLLNYSDTQIIQAKSNDGESILQYEYNDMVQLQIIWQEKIEDFVSAIFGVNIRDEKNKKVFYLSFFTKPKGEDEDGTEEPKSV